MTMGKPKANTIYAIENALPTTSSLYFALLQPDGTTETLVNSPIPAAAPSSSEEDEGFFTLPVIIGIAAAGAVLLIIILITTIVCCKRRKDRDVPPVMPGVQAYVTTSTPGKHTKGVQYSTHYNTVAQFSRPGRY